MSKCVKPLNFLNPIKDYILLLLTFKSNKILNEPIPYIDYKSF